MKEAQKFATADVAANMADGGFTRVPNQDELQLNPGAAYVHMTSNETIEGVQWKTEPNVGEVPLVCDSSSDILSRPLPIEKYGLIYAGAQKNIGPSGVTLVIMREDLLPRFAKDMPTMLDYKTHAKNKSLYNTPNTWGIYILNLACKWLKEKGGLAGMQQRERSQGAIDLRRDRRDRVLSRPARSGFTLGHERNVPLPTSEELEKKFVKEATADGADRPERPPRRSAVYARQSTTPFRARGARRWLSS